MNRKMFGAMKRDIQKKATLRNTDEENDELDINSEPLGYPKLLKKPYKVTNVENKLYFDNINCHSQTYKV